MSAGPFGLERKAGPASFTAAAASSLTPGGEVSLTTAPHDQVASSSDPVSPAPCAFGSSCESSDSQYYVYYVSTGETSPCIFEFEIDWGDGSEQQDVVTHGTPNGVFFLVASHTYGAPGVYSIDVSARVASGACGTSGGTSQFTLVRGGPSPAEQGAAENPSELPVGCSCGDPVNSATGTFWHTFTDASVPGLGVPLDFTRTYSSAEAATNGPLGYGWTDSYIMHLSFDVHGNATVTQEDGSTVSFYDDAGHYFAGAGVLASLVANGDGTYTFIRDATNDQYLFNGAGQLVKEVDRAGYATTLTYDGSGDLEKVTDQAGRSLTFAYSSGHIVSMTDPIGNTTTYTYDASGNLASTVDPLGRTWSFTYDPNHLLLSMTDPDGGTTTSTYDSSDRVVRQVDPMGRTTTWSYTGEPTSASGGATTITNPRGVQSEYQYSNLELTSVTAGVDTPQAATTSYQYDMATLGRTKITDGDGKVTTTTYDGRGDLLTTTDPLGNVTQYSYDSEGDRLTATDPLGTTTSYTYDGDGNLLSSATPLSGGGTATWSYTYGSGATAGDRLTATNPDGDTTSYGYDAAGDPTSSTDPLGHLTTASYDDDGRPLTETTPRGNTTSYAYDADGEPIGETDPLGDTTHYAYDADGNQTSVTDADGHTTRSSYDADNEPTEVTRADGSVLKTEWDAAGNMVAQINGAGDTTRYSYDPLDRLSSVTDPDGHTTSYEYDPAGHRIATTNAEGEVTHYGYDAAGELTSISYSDGTTPDVTETYDADGDRVKLTDGSGTSTFTYDSLGRMTSATNGAGAVVDYGYDPAGQLTTLTYPNGQSVTRGYDAAGDLTSVTDWLGHTTHFGYDADSELSEEQYPGDVSARMSYDDADRLAAITDANEAGTIASFDYIRDPVGQVTSEARDNGESATTNYAYDSLDQLTASNDTHYGYDAADDPTTIGATTQTFGPASELRSSSTPVETTEKSSEEVPGSEGSGSQTSGAVESTPSGEVKGFHTSGPPAPTVDAVVSAQTDGRRRLTTPRLATRDSQDLVVAFVSLASGQRTAAISGDGLRWSALARAKGPGGDTEVWQARAPGRLDGPVTIRLAHGGSPAAATVAAFAGQAPDIVAHSTAQGKESVPHDSLAFQEGALLWAVGHSAGQSHSIAARAGQQLVTQHFNRKAHVDSWVQQLSTPSPAAQIADAGAARRWTLLAIVVGTRSARASRVDRLVPAPSSIGTTAPQATGSAASNVGRTTSGVVPSATGPITRTFSYNARGDLTEEAASDSAPVQLSYDQEDRLIAVGDNATYSYNGDGLRVSKTVGGTTTQFVWNQTEATPELLESGSTYYLYGPGGMPIEQITGESPTFLLQDQQGSTRVLTDGGGAVVGRYDYDPWGKVTSHSGTARANLQFDGQYADEESGLIYLRARYYDPTTGQFMTRDPLVAQTRSPYGYVVDDPVNGADPSGLQVYQVEEENWKLIDEFATVSGLLAAVPSPAEPFFAAMSLTFSLFSYQHNLQTADYVGAGGDAAGIVPLGTNFWGEVARTSAVAALQDVVRAQLRFNEESKYVCRPTPDWAMQHPPQWVQDIPN